MPELRLLGGALLIDERGPVVGPASRSHPLALLALLATAPSRGLSRGKLVGLLWPETSEGRARGRLNTTVYRVRGAVGADAVRSVGDDLWFDPASVTCDLFRFEEALEGGELGRAVDLYGGPFLDGFRLGGSPAFEKWTDRQRDRLARRYSDALEVLAGRSEEEGELAEAAARWRALLREDPYDARIVRRLVRTLTELGNPAEALRAARHHQRIVEEELGIGTDPELREMTRGLERQREVPSASRDTGPVPRRRPGGADVGTSGDEAFPPVPAPPPTDRGRGPERQPTRFESTSIGRTDGSASTGRGLRVRGSILPGLAAVALVAFAWTGLRLSSSGRRPLGGAEDRTIAVAPFGAVGADGAGILARSLVGDLLTTLSTTPGLDVVELPAEEGPPEDAAGVYSAAADRLGAGWIVEGDVEEMGDEIQVNVQLLDTRTDHAAWADSYVRKIPGREPLEIEHDLGGRITASLEEALGSGEIRSPDDTTRR